MLDVAVSFLAEQFNAYLIRRTGSVSLGQVMPGAIGAKYQPRCSTERGWSPSGIRKRSASTRSIPTGSISPLHRWRQTACRSLSIAASPWGQETRAAQLVADRQRVNATLPGWPLSLRWRLGTRLIAEQTLASGQSVAEFATRDWPAGNP